MLFHRSAPCDLVISLRSLVNVAALHAGVERNVHVVLLMHVY